MRNEFRSIFENIHLCIMSNMCFFYDIILFRKMKELIKANEIPPWKMARWMGMLGI